MKDILKKSIAGVAIGMVCIYTIPMNSLASNESVYSKINSKGENYKTVVSIKDNDDVKQKDLTEKELPIQTKITYKLNDKEISSEDLVGKSGKVSINIEYINKSEKTVNINGVNETMYTPFVVAFGSIINNENNKNIKVSTGKIIENGGKTIVCGIALPGLSESLKLKGNLASIDIPSNVEITMDSTNFKMGNIISYATPKVLDKNIDWNSFNNLFDSANLLQDSSNKLADGTKKLAEGTAKLRDGSSKLSNGIEQVYNGSNQIKNEITSSINSLENNNTKALDDITLNAISKQAEKQANEAIKTQVNNIGEMAKKIAVNSVNSQLDTIGKKASMQAVAGVENQKDVIAKTAETTAGNAIKGKEKEILGKMQNYVVANKEKLIPADKVSQSASNAVSSEVKEIVTNATIEGAKAGGSIAKESINSITANAGEVNVDVSNISVKVDYNKILKNNKEYSKLTDEQKALINSVAKEMAESAEKDAEEQAKKQAEISAKEAVKVASKNAENSAKQSAQLAVSKIATESAKVSAQTSAVNTTSSMIGKAVTAGVNEAMNQLIMNCSSNINVLENAVLPYVGQIANETAKQVAGEVASTTAKATAKQVAESVAEETAKSVAVQVAGSVASSTARTVADGVADEVKLNATKQIKDQMQTLLDKGIVPLTNGLEQINSGAKELNNGASELEKGAKTLEEGMNKFNKEGISRITSLVNKDLRSLISRGKKLEQLANEYSDFDGEDGVDSVKFVSIIDSVK